MEDEEIAEDVHEISRRGPFRFSVCNIPVGSELVYIEDESVRVTVVDDRRIRYNGELTSLSALAQRLKRLNHSIQGTLWFTYKGEKLTDLRKRLEADTR